MKKNKRNIASISLIIIIGSLAVSCASLHPNKEIWDEKNMESQIPQNLYGETKTDSTNIAAVSWREIYSDPKLQNIIERVLTNNNDIKLAIERINEADATFRQSQLTTLPSVSAGLSTGYGKSAQSTSTPSTENLQLAVNAGWEIDIWGKLAAAKRAAYANLLKTDAAKRAVQTQLVTQAATYYYQILAYDKQIEITKKTVEYRKKDVETVTALMQAAYLTGADIAQSEANLYAAQVSIPDLEVNRKNLESSLSVLMGVPTEEITRGTLENQIVYRNLETGVPAQLLKYRPDVQEAELALRQAYENKNFAEADLYPSLNITGALGLSTRNFAQFFKNSLLYSVGAGLTQPIFAQGSKRANVKIAEARKMQAFYNFQTTVLDAGSEVTSQIYAYQKANEKQNLRNNQIASLEKAVSFNKELLTYSSKVNYVNVLTSEQALLQAQLSAVQDKLQQLIAVSNFYKAVGGYQSK